MVGRYIFWSWAYAAKGDIFSQCPQYSDLDSTDTALALPIASKLST